MVSELEHMHIETYLMHCFKASQHETTQHPWKHSIQCTQYTSSIIELYWTVLWSRQCQFKKTYHANISNYNDTFWPCHNVSPESEERTQRTVNTGTGFLTHASITWAAGDALHVIASLLISTLLLLGFGILKTTMAGFKHGQLFISNKVIRCDQMWSAWKELS